MEDKIIKILIADRDEEYRSRVQSILKKYFQDVDIADNGQRVLQLCESKDYSLVLVDNHLPGILGIEVVRRLDTQFPKMRRILTSAEGTDPVIESALEYGIIDRFLEKPVDASLLVWEIQYLLGICSEPPPLKDDSDFEDEDEEDSTSSVLVSSSHPAKI